MSDGVYVSQLGLALADLQRENDRLTAELADARRDAYTKALVDVAEDICALANAGPSVTAAELTPLGIARRIKQRAEHRARLAAGSDS